MTVAPALGPSDSCGLPSLRSTLDRGLVCRPAFAEHTMVSPFCSLESGQGENCPRRSMICRACCFCFFKQASKTHSRTRSRGKRTVGTPPARQWVHVGGCSLGLLGALVFLSTR
ncbi:unnamed protein product [Rangifer tarandus platyrhynchus]|uniref:Uncharacterized protein n=1 Tax=Rangifer tarandus platyrhynchus TaxID=3082113 RepID=A0AC59ZA93_RANTA